MAKIQIFEFKPENAQAISDLLSSGIRVLQEGFFITDGNFGIMYKEADEVGLDQSEMINPVSAEISKSQKQIILQEGLIRSNSAMEEKFKAEYEGHKTALDESIKALEEHKILGSFMPKEKLDALTEKGKRLEEIQTKFRNSKKSKIPEDERDAILKESQTLSAEIDALLAEKKEKDAEYAAQTNNLQTIANANNVLMINTSAKVKEYREKKEDAQKDKEEAEITLQVSVKLLEDIKAGEVDPKTKVLKFKKEE